jgi:2-polyprenyl-3-methyl-5-hydroxy-6-metoxy-1,4-benzoquinol methylase
MTMSNNGDGNVSETNRSAVVPSRSEPQNLSIDDIMWRVRVAVAQGSGQTGTAVPTNLADIPSFEEFLPKWKSVEPRLPRKDEYALAEFLAYSGPDFIDVAYSAILHRSPDENGFNHYLSLLRTGAATKVEILWTLCSSQEGQAAGVRIAGLRWPYTLHHWRRKRFIGPIVAWVHAFLRLSTLTDRLSASEASQAREIQETGRVLNFAAECLAQRIASLKLQVATRASGAELETLKNEYSVIVEWLTQLREEELEHLKGRLDFMTAAVQRFPTREQQSVEQSLALDSFYATFANRFRGDREVIRVRVEPYLAMVREVGAGTAEAPVIDIGCGRGEWLEVLRDNGFIGRGIDMNRFFVDACCQLGLEVIEGDAIDTLRTLPDGCVGAVTAMHVVEHLPFEHVITLLAEVRRVLRPGGLIVLETPNPENLSVAHHWFYMDPTHRNPLPPEALRWIVEARGFQGCRIERLTFARDLHALPLLPDTAPGAASINSVLAMLNAAPDYAIVARRP